MVIISLFAPYVARAESAEVNIAWNSESLVKIESLTKCGVNKDTYGVARIKKITVTAYSSTPDQTDDTPFITASGKHVEDGIFAINGLKFGTKVRIKIPGFEDKIFTVQDRMNTRYGQLQRGDIWMASREEARQFGVKHNVTLEILES